MGYKDKRYKKDLHQQAYERLSGMQAFGESKHQSTQQNKIFSFKTYKVYWENTKLFVSYVQALHPEVKSLNEARMYVGEYLDSRKQQGLSAWTIQTQAKALGKLYGITPSDPDYYIPPKRNRIDIKRSRISRARDGHFSTTNNDELIKFCKGIGARREGLSKLKGKDLRTRKELEAEVDVLKKISEERSLTSEELALLKMDNTALAFYKSDYFVFLCEKGGRARISPIIGPDTDAIVSRIKNTPSDGRVWLHIHSCADIHGYRSDYSNSIYRQYARPIEEIPYDKVNGGTGRKYQSEVYHCRKDERGRALDKRAMKMASLALGHNRIDVVANNYLRGL